jgi:hypothetical protein
MKLFSLVLLVLLIFVFLRTKVANQKICPLVQNKNICELLNCTYFDPDIDAYFQNPCQPKK